MSYLSYPIASLGSSLDVFFDAVGKFLSSLADVHWGVALLALLFHFLHLTARTRAWFNVLRAAYSDQAFRWRSIFGAYVAGVGINSVTPIHGGDVVKIYLAKKSVPNSSYPAVASSFFVESIFDLTVGTLVMAFALTQGVLPSFIGRPDLPAFDIGFWASNPKLTLFVTTVVFVAAVIAFALLAKRVKSFWDRIKQGWAIVRDRRRYLRQVVSWQAAGWLFRLLGFYLFLEAFNVDASVRNALLVMSVQSLSTLMPFTPGGAGAQQALLVYIFRGLAPNAVLLSYSVGQQALVSGFNAILGFSALYFMARTLDWKLIRRRGEREKEVAEAETEVTEGPREPPAPESLPPGR